MDTANERTPLEHVLDICDNSQEVLGYRNENKTDVICLDCYSTYISAQGDYPVPVIAEEVYAERWCCDICEESLM